MTRHSQNGWPVVGKSACDQGPFHGVTFPNGILAGDVAVIAVWQLELYADTVEPIKAGTCWGWFDKPIEGSTVTSNHASATAWDINADQHAMGTPASHSMSTHQIEACRAIVELSAGVLRWGGDYSGRPDPMHWEIDDDQDAAHAFATKIKNGEVPMKLSANDKTWISGQIKAAVDDFLTVKIGDKAYPARTVGDVLRDAAKVRGVLVGDTADTKNAALPATAPLAVIIAGAHAAVESAD